MQGNYGDENEKECAISVIISAYNRKEYIKEALNSTIDQTLPRSYYEIIVAKNYADEEIDSYIEGVGAKSIVEEVPQGLMYSYALKVSRGRIIAFLEDDDRFDRTKLETLMNMFNAHKDLSYYHNAQTPIDGKGNASKNEINLSPKKPIITCRSELENGKSVRILNYSPDFNNSSIAIKREVLERYIQEIEKFEATIDSFNFLAAVDSGGKLMIDPRKLTYLRIHDSFSNNTSDLSRFKATSSNSISIFRKSFMMMGRIFQSSFSKRFSECEIASQSLILCIDSSNCSYKNIAANLRKFMSCSLVSPIRFSPLRIPLVFLYMISPGALKKRYLRRRFKKIKSTVE